CPLGCFHRSMRVVGLAFGEAYNGSRTTFWLAPHVLLDRKRRPKLAPCDHVGPLGATDRRHLHAFGRLGAETSLFHLELHRKRDFDDDEEPDLALDGVRLTVRLADPAVEAPYQMEEAQIHLWAGAMQPGPFAEAEGLGDGVIVAVGVGEGDGLIPFERELD